MLSSYSYKILNKRLSRDGQHSNIPNTLSTPAQFRKNDKRLTEI
jgi:hypothetical protein